MIYFKRLIKALLTFLYHPVLTIRLLFKGAKQFYIAPQITINSLRHLRIGTNVSIGRNSRFLFIHEYYGGVYNPSVTIGNNVSIGNRFSALSAAAITIGDNCLIASDVLITSENHGMNPEISDSYADIPLIVADVEIGKGCWIGEKVSIMPGVTLGERCIVAANAVVTKSFPANCLIGGVPAKRLKTYSLEDHAWKV